MSPSQNSNWKHSLPTASTKFLSVPIIPPTVQRYKGLKFQSGSLSLRALLIPLPLWLSIIKARAMIRSSSLLTGWRWNNLSMDFMTGSPLKEHQLRFDPRYCRLTQRANADPNGCTPASLTRLSETETQSSPISGARDTTFRLGYGYTSLSSTAVITYGSSTRILNRNLMAAWTWHNKSLSAGPYEVLSIDLAIS